MDVVSYTRPKTLGALMAYELDPIFTRTQKTLLAGSGVAREIAQFTVMGTVLFGTAVAAANAGNTGTGTLILDADTPILAKAIKGVYTVTCVTSAVGGGTFRVQDPNGRVIGELSVSTNGVAFVNQFKAVITAVAGHDFAVGDGFSVTIPEGTGAWAAFDPAAFDGRQYASGVALFGATAAAGTDGEVCVIENGPAVLLSDELVWAGNYTDEEKSSALADLKSLGIKTTVGG